MANRNLNVLSEVALGIRWFVTDEVCAVASRALSIMNQLDKEVDKYRNEAAQALQKLAKVTAERNDLDNKYKTDLQLLNMKFHDVQAECSRLHAQFDADTAQRDTDLAIVREQYCDLQQRYNRDIIAAKECSRKEQEQANHLRQQKVDLQKDVNKLIDANEDLKKKYADLSSQFQKLSSVKEHLEVAERELDEKHKVMIDISDHLVEALQVAEQAVEKARLEAANLRNI